MGFFSDLFRGDVDTASRSGHSGGTGRQLKGATFGGNTSGLTGDSTGGNQGGDLMASLFSRLKKKLTDAQFPADVSSDSPTRVGQAGGGGRGQVTGGGGNFIGQLISMLSRGR